MDNVTLEILQNDSVKILKINGMLITGFEGYSITTSDSDQTEVVIKLKLPNEVMRFSTLTKIV